MRLIDADYLSKKFEDFYEKEIKHMSEEYVSLYCKLSTFILQSPVAYDINNVIIELSKDIETSIDADTGELLDNWVLDMQNDLTAKHICIVSNGLKQEDTEGEPNHDTAVSVSEMEEDWRKFIMQRMETVK